MTTNSTSSPAARSSASSSATERRPPASSGSTTRAAGASTPSSTPLRWDRQTIQFSVNAWYTQDFTRENRVVGVLWANKRDSGLWFAPAEWKECRLGIQVLPLSPITEVLFSDMGFVRRLVEWALPALAREGVGEGWKGFVYALEGVYEKEVALEKIRKLSGHDDGNSLSNLLWWIHSRDEGDQGYEGGGKHCWFGHYCH
ncbi:putative endo-1,3(4)-beta-glucanase, glycosyl hydrolase family 81 domain-containing protein [Helianthus annuus]|nr:putative endo-1,3(4)-beta-glucanase, glycosyl hydrolase family 81 domain-containing protein [Helianthus annuus]KAJ0543264.1 putative endo-1,3(4)-beta-glucanase, glycosyl hydrolase family 81 domain-containing protein [Helianthus annuus]KAJ0708320.1 putative endo-1,3(4)-beta-glucanase, glycosyl hydrolase family 81 domain-containing protein [Helianthus annuus]KAJ0712266.1 putative endo-1,3(4)-beta-glucanase, glycosyl hydrolase family 81 domain-containing protein [Helianthus annuus]